MTSSFDRLSGSVYRYENQADVLQPKAQAEMVKDFATNGYVIIRNLLKEDEVSKLQRAFETSTEFWDNAFALKGDGERTYEQAQWLDPGKDILGRAAGNAKTVGICEQLLNEGELYLYSGKVVMKKPYSGGSLFWHQDYGYWYNNNAPFPHFITCILALTQSDRHNGGVQVIPGSHRAGRIEHTKRGAQTGAELGRVELLQKRLGGVEYVDLAAGDSVMFHANTLHCSEANESASRRWNLIFSYNAAANDPQLPHYNACYGQHTLNRYDAHAVENCGDVTIDSRGYLDPKLNQNINTEA